MTTASHITPALLTTREAARFLGLTPKTLTKWRWLGSGPKYIRLGDSPGARVAYRVEDLEVWIEERAYANSAAEATAMNPDSRKLGA